MSDSTTETPAESSEEKRIDTLESKVDRILDMLSGSDKSPEPAPQAAEPKSEAAADARRAVQEIARRDAAKKAREAEKAAGEARWKRLEDKVFEKPPVEHRKGFTGWWQKHNQWTDEKS